MLPQTDRTAAMAAMFCALLGAHAAAAQPTGKTAQSAALFEQMATVMQHPRCLNCHTSADFPRQGDDRHRHTMNVERGTDDHGAPGLHCSTCHQAANQTVSGVPGTPGWHLAPLRMAWEGLSAGELCRALRDPSRGNMKPEQLEAHFNTSLVRWAWSPGTDSHGRSRTPPPLSHEKFIETTRQWIETGAACPNS